LIREDARLGFASHLKYITAATPVESANQIGFFAALASAMFRFMALFG